MSPDVVERPLTAPPVITMPPQAHFLNHDSEERAVPMGQMASLLAGGYQRIPQSERPQSAREVRSAGLGQHMANDGLEPGQQDVPGEVPDTVAWRRLLNGFSHNLYPTSTSHTSTEDKQDDYKYEELEDFEEGLAQLAKFIDTDRNFCQFRRFGSTVARILVHRQLQLISLIKKLQKLDQEDAADMKRKYRLYTAEIFKNEDPAQAELLREIEVKINEYYDLLLKYVNVRALGRPTKRDHKSFHRWMTQNNPMYSEEQDFMSYFDDLVSAKQSMNSAGQGSPIEDMIETYMANNPNSPLKRLLCKLLSFKNDSKPKNPWLEYYSFDALETLGRMIQAFIAVAFLLTPAFLLFLVPMSREGMACTVLAVTIAFACALATLCKLKPQEMLIGTAAYGAFLATFLDKTGPSIVPE